MRLLSEEAQKFATALVLSSLMHRFDAAQIIVKNRGEERF